MSSPDDAAGVPAVPPVGGSRTFEEMEQLAFEAAGVVFTVAKDVIDAVRTELTELEEGARTALRRIKGEPEAPPPDPAPETPAEAAPDQPAA